MHIRLNYKKLGFFVSLSWSRQVQGINSDLPDGRHFLMWDFDGLECSEVFDTLRDVQRYFMLPAITVMQSSDSRHHHAYCFDGNSFPRAQYILNSTPNVDPMYLKFGAIRKYFTLRITDKKIGPITKCGVLPSAVIESVDPLEANHMETYWTKRL